MARGGEPPAEATHKTGGRASTFGWFTIRLMEKILSTPCSPTAWTEPVYPRRLKSPANDEGKWQGYSELFDWRWKSPPLCGDREKGLTVTFLFSFTNHASTCVHIRPFIRALQGMDWFSLRQREVPSGRVVWVGSCQTSTPSFVCSLHQTDHIQHNYTSPFQVLGLVLVHRCF